MFNSALFSKTVYLLNLGALLWAQTMALMPNGAYASLPQKKELTMESKRSLEDIVQPLKKERQKYEILKDIHPIWPRLACLSITLKLNDHDPSIPIIRSQLINLGYLEPHTLAPLASRCFDVSLEKALRKFQAQHSLDTDGIYGIKSCQMLNISPRERIERIDISLLRIAKTQHSWQETKSILINLPTFELFAIEEGKIHLIKPVIIGMPTRSTPVLQTPIVQVILNPPWYVPHSIFFKDKVKKIKQNPLYLETHSYQILDKNGDEVEAVDIGFEEYNETNFPYTVRQSPGPHNALGNLKFVLVNEKAIYMHGTPDRHLFKKGFRALSSGCIRLEDPLEIAVWVLQKPQYNKKYLEKKIQEKDTLYLMVKPALNVYIVNFPVFINSHKEVVFGADPYGEFD